MTDKDEILVFEGNGQQIAIHKVKLQLMDGFFRDWHQPLFGTLPFHLDELVVKKEVAEFQIDQFANS